MSFLKHIGKHGDRKVAIIFKQIPGDEHMCLVIYPEVLPMHIHDSIMKVLESPVGQQADDLADALHRNLLPDGRNILETLHNERIMKRVQTEQVLVTPTANSNVKLSELNKLLNEMKTGNDAVKKLADLDKNAGLVDPKVKREAERQFKESQRHAANSRLESVQSSADVVLDDRSLASNLLQQAKQMELDANNLVKEAARMKKEAETLFPGVKTKAAKPQTTAAPAAPKARRAAKSKVADAAQ
jgi:hypothetical protein